MEEELGVQLRILLLTQWFDPEPTFKGLVFAKALQEAGHQVGVITGFPNYPKGKIYPGYKLRLYQKENIEGIAIHRVILYPSHDSSALKRIFNYVSFSISSFVFGLFLIRKTDVIYVYHPPMTVGFSAALLGLFRRIPFVYDIQDLWPDTLKATGMLRNPFILKVIEYICNWIYSRAKKIVVLSPGFKKCLLERGVPADKIEVIYNWCDEKALLKAKRVMDDNSLTASLKGKFNILFAGNMGKAQALEAVIKAAGSIQSLNSLIQFVFVGDGIEVAKLKNIVQVSKIENVLFVPRVEMSEVGYLLSASDVLLVHLKRDPLFEITVPSKTQAYLAMGKPILMAVEGDAADLINKANCGICVPSENIEALISASLNFAQMPQDALNKMGQNANSFYFTHLSLKTGVTKFLTIFEEVVSRS